MDVGLGCRDLLGPRLARAAEQVERGGKRHMVTVKLQTAAEDGF
jgi:hypothetical protein